MGEAVADRVGGHRLQPQAAHRLLLFAQGMLRNVTEDQFAFAPRVTGIDQAGDVLALDQAGQQRSRSWVFRSDSARNAAESWAGG
jgi:hypothetical protein